MIRPNDINLLRLLAALPLLLLAVSFSSAVVLAGICLIIALPLAAARLSMPVHISPALRDTLSLLIAAASGGIADMLLAAFAPTFFAALHAYLPLATFCIYGLMMSRTDTAPIWPSALQPLWQIILVLPGVGLMRELIGTGAAFDQLTLLFGGAHAWSMQFTDHHRGLLLALMPCTMLIVIGMLLAAKNHFRKPEMTPTPPDSKTRRVRVTGPIS